jgi:hypothetical protein
MLSRRVSAWTTAAIDGILSRTIPMSCLERVVYRKLSRHATFAFDGRRLPYFFHSYNNFGITERMIEIPIVKHLLGQGSCEDVLEIGNVTNHYYDEFRRIFRNKTTVDKFEQGYDVVNCDIRDYAPGVTYDFVFSISTFEHMDADLGRNPLYVRGSSRLVSVAADNIKHVGDTLVRENGRLVITAPLSYTPEWKETFYSDDLAKCGFARYQTFLFKRDSELTWKQVPVADGRSAPFDSYCPYRHYLSVVEFFK